MQDRNFIIIPLRTSNSILVDGILLEAKLKHFDQIKIIENDFYDLSIIEKYLFVKKFINKDKINYIIFFPGVEWKSISYSFLKILKNYDENIILVLNLVDSIERVSSFFCSLDEFSYFFSKFDYIITSDLYEAKKYNLIFHHGPLFNFSNLFENKVDNKYGVLFLGKSKNRFKFLVDIARYLQKNNIVYNFFIFEKFLNIPGDISSIHLINKRIKYQKFVLEYVKNCSCRLGLLADHAHGSMAAIHEGILYNKKVITNCDILDEYPYYESKFMKKISKASDIDLNWIKDDENVKYKYDKTNFEIFKYLNDIASLIERLDNDKKELIKMNNETNIEIIDHSEKKYETKIYSLEYSKLKKYFSSHNIYFNTSCTQRHKDNDLIYFREDTILESYSGIFNGNNLCSIGSFSYTSSSILPFMKIGRYVSIDSNLIILPIEHPFDYISTSPFLYYKKNNFFNVPFKNEFTEKSNDFDKLDDIKNNIVIGNDVYIQKNVIIARGVNIGDGVIVKSGSYVNEDIPPYAIVSGNPCKIISFRFKSDIVKKIQELEWWKYNITELDHLNLKNIDLFISEFSKLKCMLEPFIPFKLIPYQIINKF